MAVDNSILDTQVCRDVIRQYLETGSVKKSADLVGVSEVKARRILLTEGLWFSDTSLKVGHYLENGYSTKEIAEKLNLTVKAIQQYLPYSRGLYMGEERSMDAQWSAQYRERIRVAQEKVLKRRDELSVHEGWEEELYMKKEEYREEEMPEEIADEPEWETEIPEAEQYSGIVCFRRLPDGMVDPDKIRTRWDDVIRLHLELITDDLRVDYEDDGHGTDGSAMYDFSEEETRVLRDYGGVKYGRTISRDLLVPDGLALYALHYVIQACFGWENSHLHHFELPARQYFNVTGGKAGKWSELVGILFQSPFMREEEAFWADDYEEGSFKNWLRKKYTGPYVSFCHGEGIIQCTEDMKKNYDKDELIVVDYCRYEGELYVGYARPAGKGAKAGPVQVSDERDFFGRKIEKREILRLSDCPVRVMDLLYADTFPRKLLERLSIGEVLALHGKSPSDGLAETDTIMDSFEAFMDEELKEDVESIRREGIDAPSEQPLINSPTDVLYYYYDYGDNWKIRITGSLDACDLVEQGRVTQDELDQAIAKVFTTYRPVCIAADGLSLVDDAGGISGFISFLRSIHPTEEKAWWSMEGRNKEDRPDNDPYESKQSSLTWAKNLGWKEKVNVKRML